MHLGRQPGLYSGVVREPQTSSQKSRGEVGEDLNEKAPLPPSESCTLWNPTLWKEAPGSTPELFLGFELFDVYDKSKKKRQQWVTGSPQQKEKI